MNALDILSQNADFAFGVYNFGPAVALLMAGSVIDVCLKGWGMWRAARLQKKSWFIALLVMNTLGLLPILFLLMTREEYAKKEGR